MAERETTTQVNNGTTVRPTHDNHPTKKENEDNHTSQPNHSLSTLEKESKRKLKRELKKRRKILKLETRIRHALSRRDPVVEKSATVELEDYLSSLKDDDEDRSNEELIWLDVVMADKEKGRICRREHLEKCESFILSFYHPLLFRDEHSSSPLPSTLSLLQHMTKGTQTPDMFQDCSTLLGYTKFKYLERGMLLAKSLLNLDDILSKEGSIPILQSIQNAVSIGCGPGNDAVGLLGLLQTQITHLSLFDYAVDDWNKAILSRVISELHPKYVKENVKSHFCDITRPLHLNTTFRQTCCRDTDLYLFSYVLTETRGKWHDFVLDLIKEAKKNAVFYFAEPTTWQLHILRTMVQQEEKKLSNLKVDFFWVDSSMDCPHLQKLDGRLGPAVLFAIKR